MDTPPTSILDRLRDEFPDSSGRRLRAWLVAGRVRVGGEIVRDPRTPVAAADRVTLGPAPPPALAAPLRLVHEDESLLVIEKPAGLLTIGTEHERERTAYRMVWAYLKGARPSRRPFIVHRLDRETSGLLVIAKTPESKQYLQAQFFSGTAERRYVAIVEGVVTANEGTLRDVLVEERSLRVRPADPSRPPPKGRRARIAITRYRVIERRADVTRVALQLGTGRRHQIRVQLAKLGHPVVGDGRHGARRDPLRRLCLHATRLGFRHPDTGAPVQFDSAPPAAFASLGRPADRPSPPPAPRPERDARDAIRRPERPERRPPRAGPAPRPSWAERSSPPPARGHIPRAPAGPDERVSPRRPPGTCRARRDPPTPTARAAAAARRLGAEAIVGGTERRHLLRPVRNVTHATRSADPRRPGGARPTTAPRQGHRRQSAGHLLPRPAPSVTRATRSAGPPSRAAAAALRPPAKTIVGGAPVASSRPARNVTRAIRCDGPHSPGVTRSAVPDSQGGGRRAPARRPDHGQGDDRRADPRVDPPWPLRYPRCARRRRRPSPVPHSTRTAGGPAMAQAAGERVAYFNGRIVLERDVRVPFRDRGFKYGDAVFDTTRTFGHRIFRLKEHLDRLYRSLRYLRIDPGIGLEELKRITEEVLHKNLPLLEPDDDYWVTQRVTRGLDPSDRATFGQSGPTVIVECLPLPLRERATLYRDGIRVVVPSVRRAAPDSLSARTKTNNYLNVVLGDLEAKARDPEAWAILLDVNGNLAEGIGSNVFLVRDGVIYTPREQFVLPGISRETAIELARELGYTVHERDIDLFDAYNAEEAFLTSTSLCVCPVRSFNGVELGGGRIPGPVTQRVIEAYCRMVDYDFVAQYLKRLER